MVGILRRFFAKFAPVTITSGDATAIPPAAVGADRVVRAAVAERQVAFVPVAVRGVPVVASVASVPLARVWKALGPLAESAVAARARRVPPDTGPVLSPDKLFDRGVFAQPVMPPEETRELLRAIAALGPVVRTGKRRRRDIPEAARPRFVELRNRLVCGHLRLCVEQVNSKHPAAVAACGRSDLIQEAALGLARAVELFDPDVGTTLSTYAFPWIRQFLDRAMQDRSRLIRVPACAQRGPQRLSARELARFARWFVLLDTVPDPRAADPAEWLVSEDTRAARREVIAAVLSTLPKRLEEVVQKRFGLIDGRRMTLREIAEEVGLTRERVRQLEAKALEHLTAPHRLARLEAVAPV